MIETAKQLNQIVIETIDSSTEEDGIAPGWVADITYQEIDPDNTAPDMVKLAALLALRQIARSLLRGKFEPEKQEEAEQHELFPKLQARYPAAHNKNASEPVYVKLECLTDDDISWNVARLRAEAQSKQEHADALEAWAQDR